MRVAIVLRNFIAVTGTTISNNQFRVNNQFYSRGSNFRGRPSIKIHRSKGKEDPLVRRANNSNKLRASSSRFSDQRILSSADSNFLPPSLFFFLSPKNRTESPRNSRTRAILQRGREHFERNSLSDGCSNILAPQNFTQVSETFRRAKSRAARFHQVSQKPIDHPIKSLSLSFSLCCSLSPCFLHVALRREETGFVLEAARRDT